MSIFKTVCHFLIVIIPFYCSGQSDASEENYDTELIGGINLNTNANILGGLVGSYTMRINKNSFHYFGAELINVKHPKEVRVGSYTTGNLYIFQKMNHLIPLRLQYGRNFVLFPPAEEEGVQVDFIIAGGPTIGIVKPYMVEYNYGGYTRIEPFNPEKRVEILGAGGIFSGFGSAKIVPGLNVKTSFSFKFSQFLGSVTGIEVGGLLEVFPKKIILIGIPVGVPPIKNYNAYSSIFINIFFGTRR